MRNNQYKRSDILKEDKTNTTSTTKYRSTCPQEDKTVKQTPSRASKAVNKCADLSPSHSSNHSHTISTENKLGHLRDSSQIRATRIKKFKNFESQSTRKSKIGYMEPISLAIQQQLGSLREQNAQLRRQLVDLKVSQFYQFDGQKLKNLILQIQQLKRNVKKLKDINQSLTLQNDYLNRNNYHLKQQLQKYILADSKVNPSFESFTNFSQIEAQRNSKNINEQFRSKDRGAKTLRQATLDNNHQIHQKKEDYSYIRQSRRLRAVKSSKNLMNSNDFGFDLGQERKTEIYDSPLFVRSSNSKTNEQQIYPKGQKDIFLTKYCRKKRQILDQ